MNIGTLGIIREILFHIQGASNPIYMAEQRSLSALPVKSVLSLDRRFGNYGGCALLLLVLGLITLGTLRTQVGIQFMMYRDLLFSTLLIVAGGALSAGWTVPLAMFAGQGISRERTAQTWRTLLITPFSTETLLMAKAAANIDRVWRLVISLAFVASMPGLFFAGPVMLLITAGPLPPVVAVFYMVAGMVAIVAEREQEIALAIVIGMATAFLAESRRVALFYGVLGGLVIRLFQALVTIMLMVSLAPQFAPGFGLLNLIAGSAALLAVAPGLNTLLIVLLFVVLREALIRAMFAWMVRYARES